MGKKTTKRYDVKNHVGTGKTTQVPPAVQRMADQGLRNSEMYHAHQLRRTGVAPITDSARSMPFDLTTTWGLVFFLLMLQHAAGADSETARVHANRRAARAALYGDRESTDADESRAGEGGSQHAAKDAEFKLAAKLHDTLDVIRETLPTGSPSDDRFISSGTLPTATTEAATPSASATIAPAASDTPLTGCREPLASEDELAFVLREIEAAANATSASWLSSANAPDLMRQARRIAQDMELTSKPVLSPESYIYHKTRRVFEKHDAMDLFNLYARGDKTIEVARYVPRVIHSRTRLPGAKQYHVYHDNFRLGQLMFGDHNRRLKAVRKSATERMEIAWPESFPGELSLSLSMLIDDLLAEYKKSLARYFYTKKGAAAFMRRDYLLVQVAAFKYLMTKDRDSGSPNDPHYDAVVGFLQGTVVPQRVFFSGARVLPLELSGVVAIPSADGVRILLFPYSGSSNEVGGDIDDDRRMISRDSKFLTDLRSCVRCIDEDIFNKETKQGDLRWVLGLPEKLFSFMPYTQKTWKHKRRELLVSQRYDDMDSMVLSENEVISEANWNAIGKVAKYFGLLNMLAGPFGPAASFSLGAFGEGVPSLINMEMADEAADYEKYREEVVTTLIGLGYGIFTDAVQYAGTARKINQGGVRVGEVGNVGPRISAGSKLPNEARSLIDTTLSRGGMGSPNGSLQKCENEWRRRDSRSGPSNSTGRS